MSSDRKGPLVWPSQVRSEALRKGRKEVVQLGGWLHGSPLVSCCESPHNTTAASPSVTLLLASTNHKQLLPSNKLVYLCFLFLPVDKPLQKPAGESHRWDKPLGPPSGQIPLPLARRVAITQVPSHLSTGFWFLMAFSSDPPSPTFPPCPLHLANSSPSPPECLRSLGQDESSSRAHKSAGLWPLTFLLTSHTGWH